MQLNIVEITPTICLNMIVKNEAKIIKRLLNSVLPIIDTYCISDTGSTDNTIEIIQNFFTERNITGKIINHKFINFEVNRNFILAAAKDMADYILLLDADMQLHIEPQFDKSKLTSPIYNIRQGDGFTYYNIRLIANHVDAEYCGVTHEYINIKDNSTQEKLDSLKISDIGDGGSKTNKFDRDILLLTKGLQDNPNNIRYNFYLANTYFDSGKYEQALKYYEKHANIVTWNEEHFYNYYRQGFCYKHLGDEEKMLDMWIKAWYIRQTRVESLFEIIQHYRYKCMWSHCKLYYEIAKQIKFPKDDILFVHNDIYEHKLLFEYSIFAYYIGEKNIYNEMTILMNSGHYSVYHLFNNYKFYCPYLEAKKTISLSDSFSRKINKENYNFRSSTPSIIKYNNAYALNLRYVNYNIQPNGVYDWIKNIVSINKFIELNKEFEEIKRTEIEMELGTERYEGIEDIKLIPYDNKVYFMGTKLKVNGNIGIAGGIYNPIGKIQYTEFYKENEESCEKNWVFIPETQKIIYKWYPLEIYDLSNSCLSNVQTKTMPHIFTMARGSTNGFKYKDEIWFIVHFVHQIDSEPRFYYHMFVKFNEDMTGVYHSVPLKFSNEPIEYCCGLIVEDDSIIISHSIWDRESYIKVYDKKYIESLFVI